MVLEEERKSLTETARVSEGLSPPLEEHNSRRTQSGRSRALRCTFRSVSKVDGQ